MITEKRANAPPITPRWWPTWACLLLLRLIILLPAQWQLRCGALIGVLLRRLLRHRVTVSATNIRLCFPTMTEDSVRQHVHAHWRNVGISLIETAHYFWSSAAWLRRRHVIHGKAHLDEAFAHYDGVLLLPGHFTPMILVGRMLQQHVPLAVVFFQQTNAVINYLSVRRMQRDGAATVVNNHYRAMLRAVFDSNAALWLPCDQDYGRAPSVFAPFFATTAATITTYSRIARHGRIVCLPVRYHRDEDDLSYHITIEPPLVDFPSGTRHIDAARYNACIAEHIAAAPLAQYLWSHRRFKTRPGGAPSPYTQR